MNIHFHMDENKINDLAWEEYEAIEMAQEGRVKMHKLRPLMARFMVDDDNQPLDHEKAMGVLGKLPIGQLPELMKAFVDGMKVSMVPKENGNSSEQHSEASEEV